MRLDKDCVRDLMIYVEENATLDADIDVSGIQLTDFSTEEILYTAIKLIEAKFLIGKCKWDIMGNPLIHVNAITWEGHEFLDTIRDNAVWQETKKRISRFAAVSVNILSSVSAQVISQLIKNQLS